MNRSTTTAIALAERALPALVLVLVPSIAGCSDVGDSSAGAVQDGSSLAAVDAGSLEAGGDDADAAPPVSSPGPDSRAADTTATGEADSTATSDAGGGMDSGTPESTPPDVLMVDSTADGPKSADSGATDTAVSDAEGDAGVEQADGADGAVGADGPDGGGSDSEAIDGRGDGSFADSGEMDSNPQDSETPDTNVDAGTGDAAATVACTGPNTPAGCLPCKGNANGVCTPTEALVLNYDIAQNNFASSSPTTLAASCYYCLVARACLNSAPKHSVFGVTTQGKSGLECEDALSATNVAANNAAQCRDALVCTLTSNHCSTPTAGDTNDPNASVSNCYCGSHLGAACTQAPPSGGPNGVCKTSEETDLVLTDPTAILANFVDGTKSPGAVGNEILNCGLTASCGMCFK